MKVGKIIKRTTYNQIIVIILLYFLIFYKLSVSELKTDLQSLENNKSVPRPPRLFSASKSINRITNSLVFKEYACSSEITRFNGPRMGRPLKGIQSNEPIFIDGNSDFLSQASNEGWSGTGTSTDPILIKNISIISADSSNFIEIQNTDFFFKILYCNLDRGTSSIGDIGICFSNVKNGLVAFNNILNFVGKGIYVSSSFNVSLIKNEVSYNNQWGIAAYGSHYLNISENTVSNNRWEGIHVSYSENSLYIGNTVFNNGNDGIILIANTLSMISSNLIYNNKINGIELYYDSTNNLIFNNHITNNTNYGIYLRERANYNIIKKNEIDNNRAGGIYSDRVPTLILNNYIYKNLFYGIYLEGWGNVSSNILEDNGDHGIFLDVSSESFIFNNTIKYHDWGIFLHGARSNSIIDNILVDNGLGITTPSRESDIDDTYQENVTGNTINGKKLIFWSSVSNRTIPKNSGQIILLDCSNISVTHQALTNASIGLICFGTNDLIISENYVSCSMFEGMYFWYTINVTIKNNHVARNNGDGISFFKAENLEIIHNIIHDNNNDGINIDEGTNLHISNNTIYGNFWSGIYIRESFHVNTSENIICNNSKGVHIRESDLILIFNNKLFSNYDSGTTSYRSNDITIAFNEAFNNTEAGIYIRYGNNFTITYNNVYDNNFTGIFVNDIDNRFFGYENTIGSNLIIANNNNGIVVWDSPGVTIKNNTIMFNENFGLDVDNSAHTLIHNNNLSQNSIGIHLRSRYCNITSNTFIGNSMYAIESKGAWRIMVLFNNFIDNNLGGSSQLYDVEQLGGNFYSFNFYNEWIEPDNEGDGIVDNPYLLEGPEGYLDYYPLVSVYDLSVHLVSRPRVINPNGNEILAYETDILWSPSVDSFGDSVTYTIFYSHDGGTSWFLLADHLHKTSFHWQLSNVPDGSNYLVKVVSVSSSGIASEDISDSPFTIQNFVPTTTESEPIAESSSIIKPSVSPSWTLFLLLTSMSILTLFRIFKRRSDS